MSTHLHYLRFLPLLLFIFTTPVFGQSYLDKDTDVETPQIFYNPTCEYCNTSVPPVPGGDDIPASRAGELLNVSMRWGGLEGAPSIDDPTRGVLAPCNYSSGDYKTMLWRRHERPSECVWIDQCNITLRSGGTVQLSDYPILTGVQQSGLSSPITNGNITSFVEFLNTAGAIDQIWIDDGLGGQGKGIVAVSANNLELSGNPVRGMGLVQSITSPFIAVADPDIICSIDPNCNNERAVAYAAGLAFGLSQTTDPGNLLVEGGTGISLTASQCATARIFVDGHPEIDPPGDGSIDAFISAIYDDKEELNIPPSFNLRKMVVIDKSPKKQELGVYFNVNGLFSNDIPAQFSLVFDTDNNRETGDQNGYELMVNIFYAQGELGAQALTASPDGTKILVPDPEITALVRPYVRNIDFFVDPYPNFGFEGQTRFPVFTEAGFTLDSLGYQILKLGDGKKLFPNGLRACISAFRDGEELDKIDDTFLFPEIKFPVIKNPETAFLGEKVEVEVSGFIPNIDLVVFMGPVFIDPQVKSDAEGKATFMLPIPIEASLGKNLITVGVRDPDNPNNALTADGVITILAKEEEGKGININCPEKVSEGCEFPLTLNIDMSQISPNQSLGSFSGKLTWDPSNVSVSVSPEILSGYQGVLNLDKVQGELFFNGISTTGQTGSFDILGITFLAEGKTVAPESFKAEFFSFATAGTFEDILPPTSIAICDLQIVDSVLLGDINGDGKVNPTDANIILSFDVGLPIAQILLDKITLGAGDINGDGETNSADALLILNYDAQFPVPFPVGEQFCPMFSPNSQEFSIVEEEDERLGKLVLFSKADQTTDIYNLSLVADFRRSAFRLGSYSLDIQWDDQMWEVLEVKGGKAKGFGNPMINQRDIESGRISVADANPLVAAKQVHVLTLTAKPKNELAKIEDFQVYPRSLYTQGEFRDLRTHTQIFIKDQGPSFESLQLKVFPNPFENEVWIEFEREDNAPFSLEITRLNGQRVFEKSDGTGNSFTGKRIIQWHGRDLYGQDLPNGMYLLHIRMGELEAHKKLILSKN